MEEGLAKGMVGGLVSITHAGVIEMEQALDTPDEDTEHFPSYSFVSNHFHAPVTNSQLQIGDQGNIQFKSGTSADAEALHHILDEIQRRIDQLGLAAEGQAELNADIAAIKQHLMSPRPKPAVLREALSSVRVVLKSGGGEVAVPVACVHQNSSVG